jgi:hypothetical protein
VFVGNTAAISFLRFLQKLLKRYVGPVGFTDRQHSHNLFELATAEPDDKGFCDDMEDSYKDTLIQCFLDAVSTAVFSGMSGSDSSLQVI